MKAALFLLLILILISLQSIQMVNAQGLIQVPCPGNLSGTCLHLPTATPRTFRAAPSSQQASVQQQHCWTVPYPNGSCPVPSPVPGTPAPACPDGSTPDSKGYCSNSTQSYTQNQITTCLTFSNGTSIVPYSNGTCPATNQAYLRGYNDGSGNATAFDIQHNTAQPFSGKDFGDFSDLSNIPLVGGMIASHSIATGVLHNEQGVFIPWNVICQKGSQYLLESCATLLNPDSSLTAKGDTAVGCIRNGFAAAILGTKLGLSFDQIKSALGFAAGATGCGGIVDLNQIQNSPDFQSLLAAVPGQ